MAVSFMGTWGARRAVRFKTWLGGALAACMLLSVIPAGIAETPVPKIIEYKLPTGQTLFIKEDHSQPIVTIDTWVKTGSVNETDKINGVSHFLEHLLFKGTEKYGPGEIDRILEARGAEFNAATSDDFTHYYITTATPYFEEALKLHGEMMLNANIPDKELPQERKVVQEEINRANDNPSRQIYITLSDLLYKGHGYSLDTLGPKEVIANVPRESILDYYHYWYQPQNFNTVIVGDVNPEQVKKLVSEVFPAPPFQQPKTYQPPVVSLVNPPVKTEVRVLENPSISQAYIALGMLGPAMQKPEDVYALDIAMLALGSGKSSRLYRALKETRPLATDVGAANYTQKYSGLLIISGEAKPGNREAVKQEILNQLKQLRAKGITEEELAKAKTQYLKDFIFENETTDGTASSIGYNVTIGSLQDYMNHVQNVEKVTLERVQDALNRYIDLDKAVMVELLPTDLKANLKAETDKNLALLKASATEMAGGQTQTEQAVAVTAPAPAVSQEASLAAAREAISPTKTILPNGMTLITKPLNDSATVAFKIFIKGGQGVETIPGTSSLVTSMMMQGTTNRSAEDISRELESKGMSLSFSSDEDFIEVTGAAISEDLGELFTILGDVMSNPAFDEKEMAKRKELIRQSIVSSRDNPSSVAFENLSMALYPNHPYGNEGKRIETSLDKITRQDLLDYYNMYFRPQQMVVSVVGNFDPGTVSSYLKSLYPACTHCMESKVDIPPVSVLPESKTVVQEKPQLSAVWMAQGWLVPSISDETDYVPLKVLNSLVGTGMSSRLFTSLRERQGLAYVVGSLYPSRDQLSRFIIYIGTDPVNVDKVTAGFKNEMQRLQDEAVPAGELEEAKSKLIGSYALAHDTNINQAYYLGLFETLGTGYQFDTEYPRMVEKVTASDVQRVARKFFSGPSVLSLIKPAQKQSSSSGHR